MRRFRTYFWINKLHGTLSQLWKEQVHPISETEIYDYEHRFDDDFYDCIICPEYQVLNYWTTNRDGYREYKSNPKICKNCRQNIYAQSQRIA